jgi:hypothetical protein
MMHIREMVDSDIPALKAIYDEWGFDYQFPNFSEDQFVTRMVLVDEFDKPVQAAIARKTTELYLFCDPKFRSPLWRLQGLKRLHEEVRRRLLGLGYKDGHIWLPPQVGKGFCRRLLRDFGWVVNRWTCLSRSTERG